MSNRHASTRQAGISLADLILNMSDETRRLNGFVKREDQAPPVVQPKAQRKRRNNDYEDQEMIAFARLAELHQAQYPALAEWFHVPNGGQRSKSVGAKLKRMGAKAGIPDVFLLVPIGGYTFFVADMKHGKNTLTQEQKAWFARFSLAGAKCIVAYSAQEMFDQIVTYIKGERS